MQQPDKLTETRGSIEVNTSFTRKIYSILCPCFGFGTQKRSQDRNSPDYFASDSSNRSTVQQYELPCKKTLDFSPNISYKLPDIFVDRNNVNNYNSNELRDEKDYHKSRSFIHSINMDPKRETRETMDLRDMTRLNTKKKEWYNFPVFKYKEGELVLLGKHHKNLLAQISTVRLQPSPSAVQKQYLSKQTQNNMQSCKKLDEFWRKRYYYFQKFDEGIQIDKQSLYNLTPQAVSDYIAGKCYDCKTVLDAFSGVGHNATKLGTICEKVICVEQEAKKYNFLINNAKCYEIYNLELFMKPFLDISLKQKVDVAVLHPQVINEHYLMSSMIQPKHFKPNLSQAIKKAIQVAHNIVLLLPPNISVKDICYEISKSCEQMQQKIFCSCSVKIEKIFFSNNLCYVAVFFGVNVQQQIKINSQLGFIYKILRNPKERSFNHKKLIKYLREKYGIIRLLNFISQSVSIQRPEMTQTEKFVDFIRQRKLILQHKLQALMVEEKVAIRRALTRQNSDEQSSDFSNSPQVKFIEQPYTFKHEPIPEHNREEGQTITERTQSFYSSVSGFSAFRKRVTIAITESGKRTQNEKNTHSDLHIERQSNPGSVVINKIDEDDSHSLQKQSKSPASPNMGAYKQSNFGNFNGERRHTMNNQRIGNELFKSSRENLKRTLMQKPDNSQFYT